MIPALVRLKLSADGGAAHIQMTFKAHRSGTIVEIQQDALVVEMKDKKRITLKLLGVTLVHRNGRDQEVNALRVGDRVVIDVMPNDSGGLDAVMVDAQAPPKRKKSPAKTTPH